MNSSLRSDTDSLTPTSTRQPHFLKYIEEVYGTDTKALFSKTKNIFRDLAKSSSKRRFLLRCRSNDLIPTHITNACKRHNNISLSSNSGIKNFSNLDYYFFKKTLKIEIQDIHCHIKYLHDSLSRCQDKMIELKIDENIISNFFYFANNQYHFLLNKHNLTHKSKFRGLLDKQRKKEKQLNNGFINNNDTWIKNLTDIQIPVDVANIVSLGANHIIVSKFDKKDALFTLKNVESLLQKTNLDIDSKREIRERITKQMDTTLNKHEHITPKMRSMTKELKLTKKFLKDNSDVFFTHSDKGNVTVCMRKSEYKEKMLDLLSDTNTYSIVKSNPIEKLRKSTSEILKYLNNNGYLKYKYHNNQLTLTNTILAKAYGLPKIHKVDVPLRPIISLVNSPTHFLATIIYNELKSSIRTPKSHINNSFELKEKMKTVKIDKDYVLLSLDVTSLFTNVPCELVIRSLERRIDSIREKCKIPFDDILKFATFLFNNTYFTFDGKTYKQIFGTPMGSPISPLFADMVMDDLESDCLDLLKKNHNCTPIFYYRYVDDTCMCIKKDHVDLVLETFNSWDRNLKFTFEIESMNRINFLDVTLIRRYKDIITDWYQKPTASGRLISFSSNHPIQQKRNSVYNLTDRAILLSHEKFHQKNREKITKILLNNKYPLEFINKNIDRRLEKILHEKSTDTTIEENVKRQVVGLPYKSNFYLLSMILKKFEISAIPIVDKCLKSIIKLGKDKTEKWNQSNVVYQFSCENCTATYIGETKRTLKTRIDEHKKHRNENSVVSLHEKETNHNFDWKNVKILDSESNYKKRLISEMIHIKCEKNSINRKEDIFNLSNIYFPLLRTLNS